MKRLLIAAVLATCFLAGAQPRAKADCGFGIGIGLNINFSCGKRCPPPPPCGYPYGMPYGGGCGPCMAPPGMPHAAYTGGMPGTALAGMPYYGMPGLSAEQAALALAGAPGYAGYPALFGGSGYDSNALAYGMANGFAMPTWGSYPTLPAMPDYTGQAMASYGFPAYGAGYDNTASGVAYGYPVQVSEAEMPAGRESVAPAPIRERGIQTVDHNALVSAEEE